MAVFRSLSTNSQSGTTKIGLKPSGAQVGDVLYAFVISDGGGGSITPPSGWTQFAATDQTLPDGSQQWFYRKDAVVSAGDPASWTWTTSAANAGAVIVAAWSSATVATSPVVAIRPLTTASESPYTDSNATPISGTTTSGITVPSGDSFGLLVVWDQTQSIDTWGTSAYSNSLVERVEFNNADWISAALASVDGNAAGATGAVTFTGTRLSGSAPAGYATILFSIPSVVPVAGGTLIQSTAETSGSGTSGSVTINGVAAGSTLVVQVGWDNSVAGLTGISDGVAYTSAIYLDDTANTAGGSVRFRQGVAAGNYTITASFGASSSAIFMRAHEIGGVVQSGGLNQVAGQVQTSPGTGTDAISSGASAATTAANCFILGLSQNNVESPDGTGTLTAGTGYTLSGSIKHLAAEYKNVTSTGTQTATFTSTVNIGRSTSVLAFEVAVAPVITVQPTNQSSLIGQTATFSVTATGTGSLSYLWYKNTVTTGVTTSSYTTGTLASSDNGGLFYCAVTDSNGTTNSNTVRLLVSSNGVGTLGMFDPEMRILGWF